eukprot:TRINITY_DN5777_c0_g1_i3.p1 TRINITY_DN5777_c0_g1~~TRINITY_DN5777_c0_g1_i3.p1  ORF type:complete len:146 (-),score=24.38 TRINITY_DN5777_c0_g1_i3:3-440(-)
MWSTGCVMAELIVGQPMFPGDSGVDQLVEIIKVLGTPTREQIQAMNPNYKEYKFPQIKAHPWNKIFPSWAPEECVNLLSRMLSYTPLERITPYEACAHPFFNNLRRPETKLSNGAPLPPLYNFNAEEISVLNKLGILQALLPEHK